MSEHMEEESTAEALGAIKAAPRAQRQLSAKSSVNPLLNFQIFLKYLSG